jgi:zinc protease
LGVSGKVLSSKLTGLLEVLGDVIQRPKFDPAEIERERTRSLAALARQNDDAETVKWNCVLETLYPSTHAYHFPSLGTSQAVREITRADLAAYHEAQLAPGRTTISVAGDVTASSLVLDLERTFGGWRRRHRNAPPNATAPSLSPTMGTRIKLVDRPGAAQSQVSVAFLGVPRATPDYAAVVVLNQILGGQLSSRLFANLREKHGYSYYVRSDFATWHGRGPFTAGGAIKREHTADGIRELLAEIARIRTEPVSDGELTAAQDSLIESLPARFETVTGAAWSLASLAIYGLPDDEYEKLSARYRAVTAADVQRAARRHLAPDGLRIVVVGDASALESMLTELKLGPVEVVRAAAAQL